MSASPQYPVNLAEYQQSCPSSETTACELSYTDSYYYGLSDQYSSCPSSETWDNYRPVDVPLRDDSRGRPINYYVVTPNCPHCHHPLQLYQVSQSELYRLANEQRAYQEQLYLGQIPRDYYPQVGYNYPQPQAPYPYQSYYNQQYGYSGGYSQGPQEQQNYGQQQTYTQEPSLNYQNYPVQQPAAEITHQQVIPNGECEYYNYPPVQPIQTTNTQTVKCQLAQEPLLPVSSQPLPKKVDWSYTPRKAAAESGNNTKSSKFCWKYLEDPSFSLPNPRRMQPSIFEVLAHAEEEKDAQESNLPDDQENGGYSSNSLSSDESGTEDEDGDEDSKVPEKYNDENLDLSTLDDEELMAYQSYKISKMFGYDTDSAEVQVETDRITQSTENLDINGSTNADEEAPKGSDNEQSSVSMNGQSQRSLNSSKL
ncbi:hypothetical protein C7M61_002801 [Candidozyma pseudohaemuli]|uniref:Uncharacterized protein n=1 Tax=Candidozyma pseudohaemuli TaxID=418784 RepID=A0A2P7YQK1_9ASCO|nr:hypothetical protein C7M61_002801 [[Candida] pseudohaemulonii]PSK38242.1 hypothetical protein C7M61_002801 [[Candida] pseudohaemulonii]